MRYYRFSSDAERHDQTATWGALTVLYEVDDNFVVQRQLNLYGSALFVDKFDRSWPEKVQGIMKAKESYRRIRTEPLDEEASRSNEIEGLAMAERAIRELLAEGLVQLVSDQSAPKETVIPRENHDEVLRRWDTWVIGNDGPKAFFWATERGRSVNATAWRSLP